MPLMLAEFDGRSFVPCQPVQLPIGTKVEFILPEVPASTGIPPLESVGRSRTPEEQREWEEIKRQIASSEPHWPTLDEAMRYMRKRP